MTTRSERGGRRNVSEDKPDYTLLSRAFLDGVARVRAAGDCKYGPIEEAPDRPMREHISAILRHCYEALDGRTADEESGEHPLFHVAARVAVWAATKHQIAQGRGMQTFKGRSDVAVITKSSEYLDMWVYGAVDPTGVECLLYMPPRWGGFTLGDTPPEIAAVVERISGSKHWRVVS